MKNVYHFPNQTRPWVFRKIVKGKVTHRCFKSKKRAEDFARDFLSKQSKKGAEAMFFDRADKELLDEIREICGDVNPLDAVKWWKANWRPEMGQKTTVREAFDEFLEWHKSTGHSPGHIRNVAATRTQFCEAFGDREPSSLQSNEIVEWLLSLSVSPKTMKNRRGDISSFFLWCKSAKGLISVIPEVDARLLPRVERASVVVWTIDEAEAALRLIEREYPKYLPYFALRFFVGLRESEARQMRWEWINFEERTILVPGRICKTRDDWLILPHLLPDNAKTVFAWLTPFRSDSGAFVSPSDKDGRELSRLLYGGKKNVIRHTFATMLASYNLDDGKTIWVTRHTNVQTLRKHYKGVNQPQSAVKRYFDLMPMNEEK